ncbi:PIN domain-containing protein [Methylovulum psychrotolerans]|uniref:DUF4935 domain-containing protein n=1 Tax=Methylovulum psychrotolerans TaxID=1704499 RepID=A0A2S5CL76_9GAMM|nr:PIN domain-containing protein [Methylovulum psychrotolerans]POZ51570.1 hypothetical protein AADEFJLK_02437 [Methylovulum psychrotolerans]
MFISPATISQKVSCSSAPLLFFDTCIFLDILRSPYRQGISIKAIDSTLKLLKMAENQPNDVWLLTSETVKGEWEANIGSVRQELESEVKKFERIHEKLVTAANVILDIDHVHSQKMTDLDLPFHLENLSKSLLTNCFIINNEDNHYARSGYRASKRLAPSKKGKSEYNDCLIFEVFLDVASQARMLGYSGTICFVTSNSSDYGKPENNFVTNDLQVVGAKLVNSLEWALSLCR